MFKGRDELIFGVCSVAIFGWMSIATISELQKIGACIILVILGSTVSILRAIRRLQDGDNE